MTRKLAHNVGRDRIARRTRDPASVMEKIDKLFDEFPELKVIEDWFHKELENESSKHPIKDVYTGYSICEPRIPKEVINAPEYPPKNVIGRICAETHIDQRYWGNALLRYLDKIFANLKELSGFKHLISNLKNPDGFWDTISEMEFNAYFNKRFSIELEPKIKHKRLDSRITIDHRSILFEIFTPRIEKLFSWDDTPEKDREGLIKYLRDDCGVSWVESAEIRKSDDDRTAHIYTDENSAEMTIDENKGTATLKISDGRTHYLEVERECGRLNIYSCEANWFSNRAKNKLLDKIDNQIKPIKDVINEPLIIVINTSYSELDEILVKDALLGQSQITIVKNRRPGEVVNSYRSREQNALRDSRSEASLISAILVYNRQITLFNPKFKSELILNENADYPITENEVNQLRGFNLKNIT